MSVISDASFELIKSFARDGRIKDFYSNQLIHDEDSLDKFANTYIGEDRMPLEKIIASILAIATSQDKYTRTHAHMYLMQYLIDVMQLTNKYIFLKPFLRYFLFLETL